MDDKDTATVAKEIVLSAGREMVATQSERLRDELQDWCEGLSKPSIDNFDGDARNRWRLSAIATSGKCDDADSIMGKAIEITYFHVQKLSAVNPTTGELEEMFRTVLIGPNEQAVAFTSRGILRSLIMLIGLYGNGPWVEPIRCVLNVGKTRQGFRVFSLDPAP